MAIPGTSRTLWKAHGFAREEAADFLDDRNFEPRASSHKLIAAVKMIEAVSPYGTGLR
jgi:hypothetical protein